MDARMVAPPSRIVAYFKVSQNEEHVSLQLKLDQQELQLHERNHHYLLLLLARQRIDDKLAQFADSEQGWLDKDVFADMLQLSETHINIHLYRFRQQLLKVLPKGQPMPQLIERRKGELRFNCTDVHID
jgi:hypothetical protein